MLRKFLFATVVVALGLTVASAETIRGKIVSVDPAANKLKVEVRDRKKKDDGDTKKKEAGEMKEFKVSEQVKVYKVERGDKNKKEAIEGGLKAEPFTKIGRRGVRALLNVEDGVVTEIMLMGGGKKGKDQKENK